MAQTSVSGFYKTRKKGTKNLGIKNLQDLDTVDEKIQININSKQSTTCERTISKQSAVTSFFTSQNSSVFEGKEELQPKPVCGTAVKSKVESKVKNSVNKKGKSVKVTRPLKTKGSGRPTASGQLDIVELLRTKKPDIVSKEGDVSQSAAAEFCTKAGVSSKDPLLHSPSKRNLPVPEEITPSKKKALMDESEKDKNITLCCLPQKSKTSARKKLQLDSNAIEPRSGSALSSPVKIATPTKSTVSSPRKLILSSPAKLDTLLLQSRSKLILSPKLDELKKSLQSFSEKASKIKEFQSNPFKITNALTSPSKTRRESALPAVAAHERFQHLVSTEKATSLILPLKYKVLLDMFRSLDVVVSMLHNRKEKVTFEKVQEGVQKMLKRNFAKHNLGQMLTIFPSAYVLTLEKCKFVTKKSDSGDYQLVISPNLASNEDGCKKKAKANTFSPMLPVSLTEREHTFYDNLLKEVKFRHQEFLRRLNFPLVLDDNIKRWHPKFPLDSLPDIKPSPLPEVPEARICTAKDVLNRVKGSFRHNKVEKALAAVAEESTSQNITLELKDISNPKPETPKVALKGICTDLLQRIRDRESAKLLETMTMTPEQTKRLAMLDRLPKIINILWHYFVAERKAAVAVDVAVEKIIHSCNSLESPDVVKDHLKLITETYPGWLTFIEIRKGVYITIDKKRNINDMLNNFKP